MQKAKWIWQNSKNNPDEYIKFYDEFLYGGGVATLSISCDSNFSVWVNKNLAGFGQYSDYPHYKVFDEIDISSFSVIGKNEIVVVAWYYGQDSQTYFKGDAGLIYEVTEGLNVLCCSDTNTLCGVAEDYCNYLRKNITYQLGFSFKYDSRFCGQDESGGCPKILSNAIEISKISYNLYKRPCKRLELGKTIEGRQICAKKLLYDLGKEVCGFLCIKCKAPSGSVINIAYGQHILDGEVRRIIGQRDFSVEIIGNGTYFEYRNTFRRLSGRYLQISCDENCVVEFVGIQEVYYPHGALPVYIQADNRRQIYNTSMRTLELCMHEHYEDTPWREQALYAMDSRNQMLCGYIAFGEYEYARANLLLMAKGQRADKLLPLCFPAGMDFPIPFFSLTYITAMNEYGFYSKDDDFVKEHLDLLRDIVNYFLNKKTENGLVPALMGHWNFYEWSDGLDGITSDGAFLKEDDPIRFDLAINCFIVIAMHKLDEIHLRLGLKSMYTKEIKNMQTAIFLQFYDEKAKLFKSYSNNYHYSKLCNSLAVLSGSAKDLAEEICNKITTATNMSETTLSMKTFEYDALLKTNYSKYKDYILNEIDSMYGYMLEQGATSFWETIKGANDFDGAGSLCHGWSGLPIYYYQKLGVINTL